jgi:formylglycine-generating enzyme
MRDRLLYLAILAAAAAVAAILVFPRAHRPPDLEPSEATEVALDASAPAPALASARPEPPAPDAGPARPPPYVHVDPASATACGEGMVLVDGVYCPFVGHSCVSFADEAHDVCDRYAQEVLCEGRLEHRRYCVDVFEYPNLEGVVPAVMVDFDDAARACSVEGKRLCTTEEWEFACEGTEMWPYPYGIERDAAACNIDRPVTMPDLPAFSDPWKISSEVERLDKRSPSGAFPRCISPFGVRDMTGNVDEWVENPNGKVTEKPFRSALKGGYWGPVRARCRPMTSTHNAWFSFYQVGFRCCSDPRGGGGVSRDPGSAKIPRRQRMAVPPGRGTP